MRAAMKPGWEDLVRRCIQKFHAQHEGESVSYAKRHHHEGERLSPHGIFLDIDFAVLLLPVEAFSENSSSEVHLRKLEPVDFLRSYVLCIVWPRKCCHLKENLIESVGQKNEITRR